MNRSWKLALTAMTLAALTCGGCGDSSVPESATSPPPAAARPPRAKPARSEAQRPEPRNLIDLLPESTVLAVHVPNLGRTREALGRTVLADILHEPEIQKFLAGPSDALLRWLKRLRDARNIDIDLLLAALDGEAVIGVTVTDLQPGFIAGIELGDGYLAAHRLVRELGKGRLTLEPRGSVDVFTLRLGSDSDVAHVCFHRGRLLVTYGPGMLETALEGPSVPLTSRPGYLKSVGNTFGDDADYRIYANLRPLVRIASLAGGPEAMRTLRTLGLDHAESLVLASMIDGSVFRDRIVFLCLDGNPFLGRLLVNHEVSRELLGLVPGNVESFAAGRLRASWLPGQLVELVAASDRQAAQEIETRFRAIGKSLGMPLNLFLDALGDEVLCMKTEPMEGAVSGLDALLDNPLLGAVLAVRMKDEAKVKQALATLCRAGVGLRAVRVADQPAFRVDLGPGFKMEPCLVLKDGWLFAAQDRDTVDEYLNAPSGRILQSPLFGARLRTMPRTGVAWMSYTDLRPGAQHVLELLQGILPLAAAWLDDGRQVPFELQRLPAAETVTRHLTPTTSWVQLAEDGVVMETVSPVGTVALLIPPLAMGFAYGMNRASQPGLPGRLGRGPNRSGGGVPGILRGLKAGRKPQAKSSQPGGATVAKIDDPKTNERLALYTLRSLVDAQQILKRSGLIDGNGNNEGEYATLAEMAGAVALRGLGAPLDPPVLTPAFGKIKGGILEHQGYRFRLFLPGKDGVPTAERDEGGAAETVDATLAEQAWCVVAWPASGVAGTRRFYVDQQGRIHESAFPFRGGKAPDPARLTVKPGDMTSGFRRGAKTEHGDSWRPVD